MTSLFFALAAAAVLLTVLLKVRRRARPKPLVIRSPRLGILNLKGPAVSPMIAGDRSAIADSFSSMVESTSAPPSCDVLFIYCDILGDGQVDGTALGLRGIIRDSGARIVIVASENPAERCIAAAGPTGYGQANLVVTFDRRGDVFASFYRRLFGEMTRGVSMPVAWVKLAPQVPGHGHPDCPVGLFACEVGQIAFGPAHISRG